MFKTRAEISEIGNKQINKINENKSWFFKVSTKLTDFCLAGLQQMKREETQMKKVRMKVETLLIIHRNRKHYQSVVWSIICPHTGEPPQNRDIPRKTDQTCKQHGNETNDENSLN